MEILESSLKWGEGGERPILGGDFRRRSLQEVTKGGVSSKSHSTLLKHADLISILPSLFQIGIENAKQNLLSKNPYQEDSESEEASALKYQGEV